MASGARFARFVICANVRDHRRPQAEGHHQRSGALEKISAGNDFAFHVGVSLCLRLGGTLNGADHTRVAATTAQHIRQPLFDLLHARVGIFVQEHFRSS